MKRMIVSLFLTLALLSGLVSAVALPAQSAAPSATKSEILALYDFSGNKSHPRLLADRDDFARVRRLIKTDPYMMSWYERLYAYAEGQLETTPPVYEVPAGSRQLDYIARGTTDRVCNLSMVYFVSGDRRFADRAVEELLAVSQFPDWRAKEYLDMTQLAYGIAIGYDWLYSYMTEAQRTTVRDAIYEYAVKPTVTTHRNDWYKTSVGNLNTWCNGMVTIAALAIMEDYPEDCALLISDTVTNVQVAMKKLLPMGGYIEAPSYYGPGISYLVQMIDCMESTLATDFGLSDVEGLRETAEYLPKMNGERSAFNYGDCAAAVIATPSLYWFANRYQMPELAVYEREHQRPTISTQDDYLALLWYDPTLVEGMLEYEGHSDALIYSDAYESTATFRSFPEDQRRIFAGIKSGDNTSPHSDLDIGTFVLEALGERWFEDLGSDSYGLNGYFTQAKETDPRWTYYRKRTEGQNTLLWNPGTLGGQVLNSQCQITAYESGYDGGYATLDMTMTYEGASSVKRGLALFDGRSRILLQDEFRSSEAGDLYWFAHTKATITLLDGGKTAELTIKDKTLLAQIVSPSDAVFTIMEAKPLPSSPNPSGQNANAGVQKLTIYLPSVTSADISVVFTPILEESDRTKALPQCSLSDISSLIAPYKPGTVLTPNSSGVYEIRTADELFCLSEMVRNGTTFAGKTVRVMNDIDLKHRSFTPIGGMTASDSTTGKAFQGTFDGNHHTIKNLLIYEPDSYYVGLFGFIKGATVQNLCIENGYVFGHRKTASFVGRAYNSTISTCSSKAKVVCANGQSGGLIANMGGTCTVTDCYYNGTVHCGAEIAGGIVGLIPAGTKATITNCYHHGELTDTQGSCGLVGYYGMTADSATTSIQMDNCYTTELLRGSTTSDKDYVSITNCREVTVGELPSMAISLGNAFLYDCEWENSGFPVFKWQCSTPLPETYRLTTAAELRLLAYMVNSGETNFSGKTFYLENDIDLQHREWFPIGGNRPDTNGNISFKGNFDGQGYRIKNLKITSDRYYVGFFGSMSGTLRNLGIENGSVLGYRIGGGLAGSFTGTMENCYSNASVSCDIAAGGIAGMMGKVTVSDCFHRGRVQAASYSYAGGIVGYFSGSSNGSVVENCYHIGAVEGKNIGSLVGIANGSATNITIRNCYSTGTQALSDSSISGYLIDCQILSDDALLTGEGLLGGTYTQDSLYGINDGYPVPNVFFYHTSVNEEIPQDSTGTYLISTEAQLRALAYRVNILGETFSGKTIQLMADLDFGYREWIPIGGNNRDNSFLSFFQGTFEGGGHSVHNLCITSGNCFVGLFGQLKNATIRNLGIENGTVIGNRSAAGIAGYAGSSTIENCYNRAQISGYAGVGGIVGMIGGNGSKISTCYNRGRISGTDSSGGIVGYFASNTGNVHISHCYNAAPSSGGGLIGTVHTTVKNSVINDSLSLEGAPVVFAPATLEMENCSALSADALRDAILGLSDSYSPDYFMQNNYHPTLTWESKGHRTEFESVDEIKLIQDAEDLRLLSYYVRSGVDFTGITFLMTQDIDFQNRPFYPIGGVYGDESFSFRGTFQGGGHTISNLLIHSRLIENDYAALFGSAEQATICNLGIASGVINHNKNITGGIIALAGSVKLQNCFSRATVQNHGSYVGGLIGRVTGNCLLEAVYCTGTIAGGPASHGGLIGYVGADITSLTLKNCYNSSPMVTSDISGCGAFFGFLQGAVSTSKLKLISCCYSSRADATSDRLTAKQRAYISPNYYTAEALRNSWQSLGSRFVKDAENANRGFPILAWELRTTCAHSNQITEYIGSKEHKILCTDCGLLQKEAHSYTSEITTAATCTADGVKTYTCSKCSDTYTEAIAATGHTAVTDKAVAATCTTDGKTEGSHCSVCNAILVAQEVIPALGHDYSYTNNGDGTHNGDCTRCDSIVTENHVFEGETCFCGAKVLTVDESIKIYHTLDLASDISITFAVTQSALSKYDSYCMEFVIPEYDGNKLTGTSTVFIEPIEKGSYYYFTLTGMTAVRMGDMVDATLHMTKGTQEYISMTDSYSVATYAYATLDSTTNAKMLTLCADLLRYGAEAQSYKKYRTDALVDAEMTELHRSYLSNTGDMIFTATDSFLGDLSNPTITWVGKTLDLSSKVGLKFVFNTQNYSGNVENLSMKVSYKGSNGETKAVTLTGAEAYGSSGSYYSFTFYGLLASELRTIVDVAIFDGNTQLSETIRYSAESYASKAMSGTLAPLCKALFTYSDSAKAYFTK